MLWFEAMRRERNHGRPPGLWRLLQLVRRRGALCAAFALVFLLAQGAAAQAVKRLILTDGTYQTVTKWSEEGGRVRYFSAERGQWEELPTSLVDWKATEKWNKETAQARDEELKQVSGEEVARRKEEMLNNPQVAPELDPSLRLPPSGGVFLLAQRAGGADLQQVYGTDPDENEHKGLNLFRQTVLPFARRIQTLELKGRKARVQVKTGAAIFVDVDDDKGPIAGTEFRIVRLEPKRDVRVVAKHSIGLTGNAKMEADYVPAEARKFSGDWWRLVPAHELEPGEYAVVIPEDQQLGLVWDFGVEK